MPRTGPGSLARTGRRLGALCVDWAIALLLSAAFAHSDALATLLLFGVLQVAAITLIGGSVGHRVFGLRLVALAGGWPKPARAAGRTLLLCLVIPAAVWDSDQRGFHDTIPGTVLVRV